MVSQNIIGVRFVRLVCLSDCGRGRNRKVLVRCDCGTEKEVYHGNLVRGFTGSCGCLKNERVRERSTTHGHAAKGQPSLTLVSWRSMVRRCHSETSSNYSYYGGRGIRVCGRWLNSFEAFLADMGERPSQAHTLDRHPDNDGNYEPGNCRWATMEEQCQNRRPRRDCRKAVA